MALSSNVTYDGDADRDPPLRRRGSLSYIPTPLRTLEWRYVPSNGPQGGGEGTVNGTSRGRGIGAWWSSSSGGTTTRSNSSFDMSSSADGRQTCSLDVMDEDKAFFETYGIVDEGGGRAGIRLAARQLAIGVRVSWFTVRGTLIERLSWKRGSGSVLIGYLTTNVYDTEPKYYCTR